MQTFNNRSMKQEMLLFSLFSSWHTGIAPTSLGYAQSSRNVDSAINTVKILMVQTSRTEGAATRQSWTITIHPQRD